MNKQGNKIFKIFLLFRLMRRSEEKWMEFAWQQALIKIEKERKKRQNFLYENKKGGERKRENKVCVLIKIS